MAQDPRSQHISVMLDEVLAVSSAHGVLEGWMVDTTLGLAGHSSALLDAHPSLAVLGLDQDAEILELAQQRLAEFGDRAAVRRARMSELAQLLRERSEDFPDAAPFAGPPCAVLMDLGVNSIHFDERSRGFSYEDGPLDMRMDQRREQTAADIVNAWSEESLADVLFHEGGEPEARRMARAIVEARRRTPLLRTGALADVLARASRREGGGKIHPATRAFQGLRRVVNDEAGELEAGLAAAEEQLCEGGLLMVISFHEGEDRVVKRFLAEGSRAGRWELHSKKPLAPARGEIRRNRRARSARLRAARRTRGGDQA